MMNTMVPNRMTRIQVQEKFKRNFQALCARCPQLGKNQETLDDSLTSLQWLWNLNVNISNPMDQCGKNGTPPRMSGLLPAFPRNLIDGLECNAPLPLPADIAKSLCSPVKYELTNKPGTFQPTKPNFIKPGVTRSAPRNGRKSSTPAIARPILGLDPVVRSNPSSASSLKSYRRALSYEPTRQVAGESSDSSRAQPVAPELIKVRANSDPERKFDTTQTAPLPQIQTSNLKTHSDSEPLLSEAASSSRNYSFSPREAMLDLLPGQVDYKNNPYVKPAFSYTTLICMAMQNNKRHRMSFPSICKWITDNFMYYRYADPGWQNSIKLNLTQSKYFTKVHKKKDSSSKSCLWEMDPTCNVKLRDMNSTTTHGNQSNNSSRFAPVTFVTSSSVSGTTSAMSKLDQEEPFLQTLAGRKRKQTMPQKLVRRRNNAKKRRDGAKGAGASSGNKNLLQEQAPELGSLKGDFNWNSIFDEFFGSPDVLSVTPTSLASRPSTNEGADNTDIIGQFSDDVGSGSLLAHDVLLLPDIPEPGVNDENHEGSHKPTCNPATWDPADRDLQSVTSKSSDKIQASSSDLPLIDLDLDFVDVVEDSELGLEGFLKDVGELDLTITGRQIEPPAEWIPVCPDLDAILCEKQNDNIFEPSPPHPPLSDVDRVFSHESQLNSTDQYLSQRRNTNRARSQRKSGPSTHRSSSNNTPTQDHHSAGLAHRRPWQEVKDATETIENLLSSTFQCN